LAIDAGEGHIELNRVSSNGMELWEDTAPKEFICKCYSNEGFLVFIIFGIREKEDNHNF